MFICFISLLIYINCTDVLYSAIFHLAYARQVSGRPHRKPRAASVMFPLKGEGLTISISQGVFSPGTLHGFVCILSAAHLYGLRSGHFAFTFRDFLL